MSSHQDKVLSALGLAMRAGKLSLGTEMVQDSVRNGKSHLLVCAGDISDGSRKKLTNTCSYYNVELIEHSEMSSLASALGKKKPISSVSVNDLNFKILIKKQFAPTVKSEND